MQPVKPANPDGHVVMTPEQYAEGVGVPVDRVVRAARLGIIHAVGRARTIRIKATTEWPDGEIADLPAVAVAALRAHIDRHGLDGTLDHLTRAPRPSGTISPRVRSAVLERDGRICRYCRKAIGPRTRYHLDHVVPRSLGGRTTVDNLVVACMPCNHTKGSKDGYTCTYCDRLTFDPHRCR